MVWLFQRMHREPKQRADLVAQRQCPECNGFLARVAQRQFRAPYRWVPVGYRCIDCGDAYIESTREV